MRQAPPRLSTTVRCLVVALVFPITLLHAQRPVPDESWARQFGTNRFDQANGIAVADGNVYVVGDAIGALPGQVNEFPQEVSGFVRKYDSKGTVVWTQTIGSTTQGEDHATSVTASASGVYVAGWTAGALPGQGKIGYYDAFVRKYDVNGAEQWTHQFGTTSSVQAFGVAVDGSGVYVAGFVNCCNGAFPGQVNGGADAVVRKYDLDGKDLWTRQFGSPDVERATSIAADATGIYVTGATNGAFAGPSGQGDGFLRKYDADGKEEWTRQFGTTNKNEESNVVAVGPSGIYVGGRTTGSLQGDPPAGLWDAYVMQFDRSGMLQWTRQFGGKGDGDNVFGLAVGLTHLIVTGAADGALPGQTFVGGQDAFYRLYDFTGAEAGTREFGNGLNDFGAGAAADARALYIAGTKNGAALGLAPIGDNDALVMKMAPKPLEKEEVQPGRAPARGGVRGGGAGRAGRAGRGN